MNTTPNYGLRQPKATDNYSIDDFNYNAGVIDEAMKNNAGAIADHVSSTTGVHGATSAATPNTLVQRDAQGRIKAAAPSASDDVARKAETDAALTAAQNAQATANAALPKAGGTVSGDLIVNGALRTRNAADSIYIGDDAIIEDFNRANAFRVKGQQNPETGDIFVSTNNWKVWHQGNDGHGSGLDADLLDGMQPSTSASANTIVQRDSSGRIKAAAPSASDDVARKAEVDGKVSKSGDTMTGKLRTAGTRGVIGQSESSNSTLEIMGNSGEDAAFLTFHRPNIHAVHFGLDTNNELKFGGYSEGTSSYRLWTEKNFPYETGSWTPNVEIGGVLASYAYRSGTYIRIGKLLYWSFYIELSSKNGGVGGIAIGAFPFPIAPGNGIIPMGKITGASFPSGTYWAHLHLPWDGATFFWLQASGNLTGNVSLTGNHLANNSILAASGVCRIWP